MDDLNRAFALWLDITSFDPQLTRFRAGDVDISQMNTMIEESLKLDSSSITTYLLLDYFVETYLDSKSFCVNEVLGDFEGFNTYLTKCKELYTILRSENLISIRIQIEESVLSALTHYGIDNPDTEDMVRNHHNLAFLRRDALRSMESLEIHQFYQGQPATEKPKYYTHVFEFRNINSLLKSVVNSRNSGVSLSLIREPSTLESFFVFGIRNGSTVSFLTDRPRMAHPIQGEMSRRKGKSFNERWGKHHFPYGLLGLDFDRRGDAYAAKTPGIVPYQEIARKLIPIKDMAPDEIIWTIMMFSLIEQKLWKEDFKAEELSYTGEMIATHNAALEGVNALALTEYNAIEIMPISSDEVSTANMVDEWECTPTRQNEWIEKRYSHLVNDSVLFLMGDESNLKLLPGCDQPALVRDYDLRLMSGTTFGTQEKLISDVRWHARYNKARY